PQIDLIPLEHVMRIHRMQRIDLRVRRFGQVNMIVALDRLVEKGEPEKNCQAEQQEQRPFQPFHRNTGLRPAVVSSTRLVRVVWGAVFTSCGSISASLARAIRAAMNWSSSRVLSGTGGRMLGAPRAPVGSL